ncbi:hypothetical protein HK097_001865 [Rhizophlyctis rosea]|uniref:Uncharacterized protein n=1 Tax=Rhizophlyctis rosea TaxID=64517 RepID=A0AAD5SBV8_9FUNG|nr:hypothetical protein HK097_001865 [Rhizophlyctis rosea]
MVSIVQTHECMISSNTAPEEYLSRPFRAEAIGDVETGDKGGDLVHFDDGEVYDTYFLAKVELRVVVAEFAMNMENELLMNTLAFPNALLGLLTA